MNLLDILMGAKGRPGVAELLKQYIRDAMPGGALNPEVSGQGVLDSAAVATTPVPLLGDVVGLAADANRYANEPEERTPGNFALSALGLLPFVPAMSTVKARKDWVPKARDKKVNKSNNVLIGTQGFAPGPNMGGGLSPQKWRSMENRYQQQVERGAPFSRYWYDDASQRLFDLTGQDVPRSDRLAQAIGETSAGTPVDANTGHAVKGWNQFMAGDSVATGMYPVRMGAGVDAAMRDAGTTGFKRSPFAGGLSVAWRPNASLRPVNDIHNTAAFGVYEPGTDSKWRKGLNEAQHRLLDRSVTNVRKRVNEKATTGRNDALVSGAMADDISGMLRPGFTDYQIQSSAWAPERFDSLGIPMDVAARHYGDFLNKHEGIITREWAPAPNSDMWTEYHSLPDDLKQQISNALESTVIGKAGTDRVITDTSGLSGETFRNAGMYEGVSNPGFVTPIPLGKTAGGGGVDESSRKLADAGASIYGLLMPQKQVAWNFRLPGESSKNKAGMVQLVGDDVWSMGENVGKRPMTPELLKAVQRDFADAGLDPPMADMTGARSLIFMDEGATADRKAMDKATKAIAQKHGFEATYAGRDGNLLPFDAPEKWSSEPYIAAIEKAGVKGGLLTPYGEAFNKNIPAHAARIESKVASLAEQHGLTNAPWYGKLMEALKSPDAIRKLREYRNAGIIPAAAFSALGLRSLAGEDDGGA